jgi:protein SCO1/2
LLVLAASAAQESPPRVPTSPIGMLGRVEFNQKLNAQVPVDAKLCDDTGRKVELADCMDGKPTVVVLAYYRCPMLCNQVLNGIASSLKAINLRPGEDYSVVVISFDPTDTVEMAAAKKQSILNAFGKPEDAKGWHFLVGEEPVVKELADSVGFRYEYDTATNQFAHASGVVLLTPAGRVSRYFYGIEYPTRDVRLGLVEASAGKIGNAVDELLLLCFHYDPLTGRYGLAIMRVIQAAGFLTVAGIISYIGISLYRERSYQQVDEFSENPARPLAVTTNNGTSFLGEFYDGQESSAAPKALDSQDSRNSPGYD